MIYQSGVFPHIKLQIYTLETTLDCPWIDRLSYGNRNETTVCYCIIIVLCMLLYYYVFTLSYTEINIAMGIICSS